MLKCRPFFNLCWIRAFQFVKPRNLNTFLRDARLCEGFAKPSNHSVRNQRCVDYANFDSPIKAMVAHELKPPMGALRVATRCSRQHMQRVTEIGALLNTLHAQSSAHLSLINSVEQP
ncbi:unnamed protein product [Toxocara canis]|uniref:Uncharacterized protein n=1 Tax=Toxocara canis TaxID=6265 RepID=A0A183U049_TOXCA|nr:unnamed protein product [Toxocara canis]